MTDIATLDVRGRLAGAPEVDTDRPRRTRILVIIGVVVAAISALVLSVAEVGPSGHLVNPNPARTHVYDGVSRANPPFLGVTDWTLVFQVMTTVLVVACWTPFVVMWWRRRQVHPGLVLMFALWIAVSGLDPLANWGFSAAYDPRILHWPLDLPYLSLAPTVEPVVALVGWQWWYLLPGFLGFWIWKRLAGRARPTSFLNRRPLRSLFLIGFAVGAVIDVVAEILFIRSAIYIYSQMMGPQIGGGKSWQFPIIWAPLMQLFLYGFSAMFLWRDDRGQTVCGRLASRIAGFRRRPVLGEIAVASTLMVAAYLVGIAAFATVKANATTLSRPWPFEDTAVYDPHGLWADAGEPGPTFRGVWSTWPWEGPRDREQEPPTAASTTLPE